MNNRKNDPILMFFNQEIQKRFGKHLKQAILFGSRARGDEQPDSDYDCLIILDEVTPDTKETVDEIAGDLLFNHNAVFSIFPISVQDHLTQKYNPFLINAMNEGVQL
jgi:predicted nucleotidyltransferase